MILQQRNQNPGRSDHGVVQRMAELQPPLFVPVADVGPPGLEVVQIRRRVGFAVGLAARHPGLNVVLLIGLLRHIPGTDGHHPVRQLQQLQQLLCMARNLLQHPLR
ncbi:hypothetical protein D3C73_1492080 [compost metagenome]